MQAERNEPPRRVRVLHTGDIGLGDPYTGLPAAMCIECRRGFYQVFDDLFAYIQREQIDLVLIAGNLYGRYMTGADAERILEAFSAQPDCRFVIAPGDRDPITTDSLYRSKRLPSNVYVFDSDRLSYFDFPELSVRVYGWAFLSPRLSFSPLRGQRLKSPARINLVCGCGELGGGHQHGPITEEEIAAFGADYTALARGAATPLCTAGGAAYAYAGCLEGKGYEEPGLGGAVDLIFGEDPKQPSFQRLYFAKHRYETLTLDVDGIADRREVIPLLREAIKRRGLGRDTSLRVTLTGAVYPTAELTLGTEESRELSLYSLEFCDHTLPTYEADSFLRDMTVHGELYRTLLPRLQSGELDERVGVAEALRAGLSALDAGDLFGV